MAVRSMEWTPAYCRPRPDPVEVELLHGGARGPATYQRWARDKVMLDLKRASSSTSSVVEVGS